MENSFNGTLVNLESLVISLFVVVSMYLNKETSFYFVVNLIMN